MIERWICFPVPRSRPVVIQASQYVYSFPERVTVFFRIVPPPFAPLFAMVYDSFRLTPGRFSGIIIGALVP